MKKRILTIGLALSILASGMSVFAQDTEVAETNEKEIMLISEEGEETAEVAETEEAEVTEEADAEAVEEETETEETAEDAEEVEGEVVLEVENSSAITFEDVAIDASGIEIAEDVLLFDNAGNAIKAEDIKEGVNVRIFKEGEAVIAIILIDETVNSMSDIDVYTTSEDFGDLINAKNELALNIGEEVEIKDLEGNDVAKEELSGKKLMVFYSMMTMSIPAQTTPEKIVVLGDAAEAETETEEVEEVEKISFTLDAGKALKSDDVTMLPLREVAEGLGYEVGWDNELRSVTVGTVPMGVNFVVGQNSYNKARMMPATLEKAPEIIENLTYVPVSFFTEIIWADVAENEDETITVTLK